MNILLKPPRYFYNPTAKERLEIIFGCLLGHAQLLSFHSGSKYRVSFIEPISRRPYIELLFTLLYPLASSPPAILTDISGEEFIYFSTKDLKELKPLAPYFHHSTPRGNFKLVPPDQAFEEFFSH